MASHVDQSSFDEKQGIKITTIFAGDRKNDLNPHEPLTNEGAKVLQTEVNRLYEMFIQLVSRNRGITAANVENTEAGLFFGSDGISSGLADDILTLSQTLELMTQKFQPKLGTIAMTNKTITSQKEESTEIAAEANAKAENSAKAEPSTVEEKTESPSATIDTAAISALKTEAETKGREAYRAEVMELAKICNTAQMPDKLAGLVERGVSVDAAKDELMQVLVAQNQHGSVGVNSSVVPLEAGAPKESPVVAAAKARAKEEAN